MGEAIERQDIEALIATIGRDDSPAAQLEAAEAVERYLANRDHFQFDDGLADRAETAVRRYRDRHKR